MVTTSKKPATTQLHLRTISATQSMLVHDWPILGSAADWECWISGILCHAFSGVSLAIWPTAAPLVPIGLPGFSIDSRNGLMMSIGIGKTTVEFCSAPISESSGSKSAV